MAITSSAVIPSNSLEEFRIEFNKLVTDVDGISAASAFGASISFEGATTDDFETTLIVTDPTADRTITLPNVTGTVLTTGNSDVGTTTTSSSDADFILVDDAGVLKKITAANLGVGTPTDITVADESSDTTCFPLFATAATGDLGPKSGSNLTFNSSTGVLGATKLSVDDDGTIGSASSASAITISSAGLVTFSSSAVVNGTITGTSVKDEDSMSSNSATHLASQQSIKAYVDANTDLVNDTTPQLGGFLDANSKFISHSQGAAIASVAGDTNIWVNFDGNTVHITGTNAITDFGTPKSAGDSMWVIFDAAASVVDSATITVAGNTNYQAAANALALVYALTTSTFLFMPFPNSGASPVASAGGGGWLGESGSPLGTSADIIRVNEQTLNNSVTVAATDNGSCTGPLTIASGVTLTITSGGTLTLI